MKARAALAWLGLAAVFLGNAGDVHAQTTPIDSVSPVFQGDSAKAAAIRAVEAGKLPQDTGSLQRDDSLLLKQKRRGPYVGFSAGVSFADNSAKNLFAAYMKDEAAADSARIVQSQDPVQIFAPVGLVLGIPVFPYLDVWFRTEHFWSRVNGLTQRGNASPREFWYVAQGHLAGVGARYLVPVSLLSVTGKPGLYAAYTHFWSFGPTGLKSPTGDLKAETDPAGAGYEVQLGYQQDYDKRFTFTGGLSFASLTFASKSSWRAILPNAPDERAEWTLQALRFSVQGVYQIGK
jgi:hypothetical protein